MIGTAVGFKSWASVRDLPLKAGITDPQIEEALTTASGVVSGLCGRRLESLADQTVYRKGTGDSRLLIPEMLSISSLTEDGNALTIDTDYRPAPDAQLPYRVLERVDTVWPLNYTVKVVGTLGYAMTMPSEIVSAVYVVAYDDLHAGGVEGIKSVAIQGISVTLQSPEERNRQLEQLLSNHIAGSV